MQRQMKWVTQVLLILLIVLNGLIMETAVARAAETPFGQYRFSTPTTTIQISGSAYYQSVWKSAIKAWNKTGVFTFKVVKSSPVKAKGWSNTTTELGISGQTQLVSSGQQIKSAVARINTGVFKYYKYSKASRIIVAEHELGHVIGLNHSSSQKSVMYYKNRYVGIQAADIASVRNHYAKPLLLTSGFVTTQLDNTVTMVWCNR